MEYLKKRKKFIDFDGVIKDTYHPLFEDYFERRANGEYVDDTLHVIRKDWIYVLEKSPIINNAINIINELDDVTILTRIHSLENEGVAKIKDLRALGAKCDIILVPYTVAQREFNQKYISTWYFSYLDKETSKTATDVIDKFFFKISHKLLMYLKKSYD